MFRSPGWPVCSPLRPDAYSASPTPAPAPTPTTPAGERHNKHKDVVFSEFPKLIQFPVCVFVCSLLSRSSSYTRRLNSQSAGEVSGQNPSLPRSSSYGRKLDDPSVTSVTTGTSGLSRLNNLLAQRFVCVWLCVLWPCVLHLYDLVSFSQIGSGRGWKEGARLQFCNRNNHVRRARDQTETKVSVWWFIHDGVLINLLSCWKKHVLLALTHLLS